MDEDELVRRILDEADMAARPGQYDRLVAIANEVAALRDNRILDMAEVARQCRDAEEKRLADLRAKVEALAEESHMADSPGLIWRSEVIALIEEADRG